MEISQTLLDKISSKDMLHDAWSLLNKENDTSRGLSKVTVGEFSKNLDSNINLISYQLKRGTFQFSPTRAAVIKKDNGKYRPLQIPEVGDRVVLKAIAILLESELQDILIKSEGISFAYQKGKGVRDAVLKMKSIHQTGKAILKADIVNFFEEVNKKTLLMDMVYPNLKDDSINRLIYDSISQKLCGVRRIEEHRHLFKNAGVGIPQGNPLSPLLSNLYLSRFDQYCKESGLLLIRYADDFIVIFDSQDDAKEGYKKIYSFLNQEFSLKVHSLKEDGGKTEIIDPTTDQFKFLGINYDGHNIYPGKETVAILKQRIRRYVKGGVLNQELFDNIYLNINKWLALYSYLDIERYFAEIDSFLISELNGKFGKRIYKTSKCELLVQKIRSKQHDRSIRSFWRNPDLVDLLPSFIKRNRIFTAKAKQTQMIKARSIENLAENRESLNTRKLN